MKLSCKHATITMLIMTMLPISVLAERASDLPLRQRKTFVRDDPPGTKVFADTLPASLQKEVDALEKKYTFADAPNDEIHQWIVALASREIVKNDITEVGGTMHEDSVARRKVRNYGLVAIGPLIRETARPNPVIRSGALGAIVDIAIANNMEIEILPVVLRFLHALEQRYRTISSLEHFCVSLAKKKRYEDLGVCLGLMVQVFKGNDEDLMKFAFERLHRFDRLDLVPNEYLERPETQELIEGLEEMYRISTAIRRYPLPKDVKPRMPQENGEQIHDED